jgi:glucokinase
MKENDPEVNSIRTSLVSQPYILAGDVGATKTLVGIFTCGRPRPQPVATRTFATSDFRDLTTLVAAFFGDVGQARVEAACLGLAGPVAGDHAKLTNADWRADAGEVERTHGVPKVVLLNDLQAMALAVPVLAGDELHVLQAGSPAPDGNMALIAAGTGLGEAMLHRVDGRFVPTASEGGHADFAARNEREIDVWRALAARFGRVEVERVLSGPGLANLHRAVHRGACHVVEDVDDPGAPGLISTAAMTRACQGCIDALDLFVDAYGAEAGNLALRSLATSGLFIGGGIAPKILPALESGRFLRAFLDKAPMEGLLARMPVQVILNAEAGLLGAAVGAAEQATART